MTLRLVSSLPLRFLLGLALRILAGRIAGVRVCRTHARPAAGSCPAVLCAIGERVVVVVGVGIAGSIGRARRVRRFGAHARRLLLSRASSALGRGSRSVFGYGACPVFCPRAGASLGSRASAGLGSRAGAGTTFAGRRASDLLLTGDALPLSAGASVGNFRHIPSVRKKLRQRLGVGRDVLARPADVIAEVKLHPLGLKP